MSQQLRPRSSSTKKHVISNDRCLSSNSHKEQLYEKSKGDFGG
jgi:hypothetical protein